MKSPLQRLYRTKLVLLATVATVVGITLLVLAHWAESQVGWTVIRNLPVADVGSALFTSGLIVIFFEYVDHEDEEARETERLQRVLADSAPDIRNAVVDGFAFAPESLTSVASPATIDRIIENCLALQLDDRELASDAYTDLRAQVLRSPSRRYDTHVSVVLSPWDEDRARGRSALFTATVKWEYRVVPDSQFMRFACVSDRDEYRELLQDPESTATWHFRPVGDLNGASPKAFQFLGFTLDGNPLPTRRTNKASSQVFTVDLGDKTVSSKRQVAISYSYRVLVQRNGHLLHLDFSGHPFKNLNVQFSYGGCGIGHVNVLDYISGPRQPRINQLPPSDATPLVEVSYDGWVFPKGGVAFVWILESELPSGGRNQPTTTKR